MASIASTQWPRLLEIEEFLQIDFGPDLKAELDEGVIRMMAGGTREHGRIQARLIAAFVQRLSGSGCFPYGSDNAVRTKDRSMRYPDITVDCGSMSDSALDLFLTNPRVVIEILSPSTREYDLTVKRAEYRAIPSIDTIVFVDPDAKALIVHQRFDGGWSETLPSDTIDLHLPSLDLVIPHTEIFARD